VKTLLGALKEGREKPGPSLWCGKISRPRFKGRTNVLGEDSEGDGVWGEMQKGAQKRGEIGGEADEGLFTVALHQGEVIFLIRECRIATTRDA